MSRSVHVVALAARTPVGPVYMARVPGLESALLGWQRIVALGRSAMQQLAERLAATSLARGGRISILLGLPEQRPGWTMQHAASTLAELAALRLPGLPTLLVEDVARGHAAALEGLRVGCERILEGTLDWCVVGGIDKDGQHTVDAKSGRDPNKSGPQRTNNAAFAAKPGHGVTYKVPTIDRSAEIALKRRGINVIRTGG